MTHQRQTTTETEYQAFPEIAGRDDLQVRVEVPLLLRALRLPPAGRILETGCGSGAALLELTGRLRPAYVAGADIDRNLLDGARTRFAMAGVAADFFHVDVRALPFADESFDIVVDFGTCYHIARPAVAAGDFARIALWGSICSRDAGPSAARPSRAVVRATSSLECRAETSPRSAGFFVVGSSQGGLVNLVRKRGFEPLRSCDRQPLKLEAVNADRSRPRKIGVGCPSSLPTEVG